MSTPLPPLFGFEPYTPERTARVRSEREAMWRQLEADAVKKPRKTRTEGSATKPSKPRKSTKKTLTLPAGLPPELRELLMQAAFQPAKGK